MADMEKIRARLADPDFDRARGVAEAISARIDSAAQRKLAEQAVFAKSKRAKVTLLHQLADNVGKAAAGLVPCKRGCNECCYMATACTVEEAELIARATGATLTMPQLNQKPEAMRDQYTGVACTFLTEQGCGIYEQRPQSCRLHHSVDVDATLCAIVPGEVIRSLTLDVRNYESVFLQAFGAELRYADIRDFFGPQPKRGRE